MKPKLATLATLGVLLMGSNLFAEASATNVKAILGEVAAAYRSLTAFSATVRTTRDGGTLQTVTTRITLQKPNRLAAEIVVDNETRHVIADGAAICSDSSRNTGQYIKESADTLEAAIDALRRSGGVGIGLLPILLTSAHAENQIIPGKPLSVNQLPDVEIDGQKCQLISAITEDGTSRYEYAFGKQDHLLRRFTISEAAARSKPRVVEIYSGVTLSPQLNSASFRYPPGGAVAPSQPKAPDGSDPRLRIGAAPLPIVGNDLAGNSVSLEQYKGKVLLIDFWATWCGPCVAEMPNVASAYNKYHGQGFEIVGVSLDQPNSRPRLEKFIADNRMPWRQIYDGKYWEAENAKTWAVHAIPFTVLIGRDGKIAAIDARGNTLGPAIEAALKRQ